LGGSSLKVSAVVFTAIPEGAEAEGPAEWTEVRFSSKMNLDEGYLSEPQSVEFPTAGVISIYPL
jgi:hypothetical protein